MLLFVLEVIEITEPKDADRENDFRAMLKYSDVWKTLLKAKGKSLFYVNKILCKKKK